MRRRAALPNTECIDGCTIIIMNKSKEYCSISLCTGEKGGDDKCRGVNVSPPGLLPLHPQPTNHSHLLLVSYLITLVVTPYISRPDERHTDHRSVIGLFCVMFGALVPAYLIRQ